MTLEVGRILTRSGLEPTTFRSTGGCSNHCATQTIKKSETWAGGQRWSSNPELHKWILITLFLFSPLSWAWGLNNSAGLKNRTRQPASAVLWSITGAKRLLKGRKASWSVWKEISQLSKSPSKLPPRSFGEVCRQLTRPWEKVRQPSGKFPTSQTDSVRRIERRAHDKSSADRQCSHFSDAPLSKVEMETNKLCAFFTVYSLPASQLGAKPREASKAKIMTRMETRGQFSHGTQYSGT